MPRPDPATTKLVIEREANVYIAKLFARKLQDAVRPSNQRELVRFVFELAFTQDGFRQTQLRRSSALASLRMQQQVKALPPLVQNGLMPRDAPQWT